MAAHAGNVDTVIVSGNFVKRQGKMLNCDLERLRSLAQESLSFVLSN